MKEIPVDTATAVQETAKPGENGETCKGQCGYSHLCRECLLQKQKLHEEKLNHEE